jgi:N-acetylglucosamine transport system permease protein
MDRMKSILLHNIVRLLLIVFLLIIVIPFVPVVLNSFKSNAQYYESIWSLTTSLALTNYTAAYAKSDITRAMLNSGLVCAVSVFLTIILGSMVAYILARRHIRYEKRITNLYLIGLLIPQVVGIIPQFFLARIFNLYDNLLMLVFTYTAFELPFAVFLLTAFCRTLPDDLEEAATIDGAGPFQTFLKIILPLTKPGIITVGIFAFLDFWSEYARALVFISSETKKTIAIAIMTFKPLMGFKIDWGILYAVCILFILPVIILYAIFQRRLIDGLTAGGVKG